MDGNGERKKRKGEPIRARRRFGQHFLESAWADKVVEAIAPSADDEFVEIGPGPGAVTVRLAPRVAHVTAVEIDRDMVAALRPRVGSNVTIVEGDFLGWDLAAAVARGPLRVAGNLPYNVASPILAHLVRGHRAHGGLTDATLMLQREVADRLEARPGTRNYSVLGILTQLHADVRRVLALPPGAFRPPPKVHSAVVRLTFKPAAVELRDERVFEALVRSVFTQRRKTVANALRPFAATRNADGRAALAAVGIDPGRRPETLTLRELGALSDAFS
jgi:16S rRNA (adenine1518-N6/adenine1519-N6)-dimethyltransferase